MPYTLKSMVALAGVSLALVACDVSQDSLLEVGPQAIRASSSVEAIQGGSVDTGDPAVVAIVMMTPQGGGICTGSLIGPNLVLTAHHCVADSPASFSGCASNVFGATFSNSSFAITTSYNAAANVFNSGYFPNIDNSTWFGASAVWTVSNDICGGDIALIKLSANVPNICPLVPRVDQNVSNGETYRAVGFGINGPMGRTSGTRYSVSGMSVLCAGNCGYGMSNTLEWVGGSSQQKGTCEGDSGGPALDGVGRVLGAVSRGPGNSCNQTTYESAYGHGAWLRTRAAQAAQEGNYQPAGWVTGGDTGEPSNGYCPNGGTGGGGGAGGGMGAGGGSGLGGGGGAGGGPAGGACASPSEVCMDATQQGDYICIDPSTQTGVPANAPSCTSSADCPVNSDCWRTSRYSSSGRCLQWCTPGATGTGGGSGAGGGAGGGSSTPTQCSDASLTCLDVTGQGSLVCVAVSGNTAGFPPNAPSCTGTGNCPSGYSCWQAAGSGNQQAYCLEDCSGNVPAGGGSGAGGGVVGAGGGAAAGGGTAGTGGGDVAAGGGEAGAGGGDASGDDGGVAAGGGAWLPPVFISAAETDGSVARLGPPVSCGCTSGVPMDAAAGWLGLLALGLVARRRRLVR